MDYNNGFSLSSFFLSLLSFLWIGAQFPQEKFLSYGRILTLDFHFLIMCILMAKEKEKEKEVGGEGAVAPREPGVKRGKLLNHTWITNQPFHAK